MWPKLLEEASRMPQPGLGRPGGSIVWFCAVLASTPASALPLGVGWPAPLSLCLVTVVIITM